MRVYFDNDENVRHFRVKISSWYAWTLKMKTAYSSGTCVTIQQMVERLISDEFNPQRTGNFTCLS